MRVIGTFFCTQLDQSVKCRTQNTPKPAKYSNRQIGKPAIANRHLPRNEVPTTHKDRKHTHTYSIAPTQSSEMPEDHKHTHTYSIAPTQSSEMPEEPLDTEALNYT